jgi:uncharacterized damage-inducible protein DinB
VTSPAEVLRDSFAYHAWATRALLDAIERLGPETLDGRIDGTYGSISATLTHLVDSDTRYQLRMREPTPPPVEDHPPRPLAELRELVDRQERRWSELLDELERGDLDASIVDRAEDYPDVEHAETLLFLQALHHGNDHRTQVCSTLGALGLEVPETDVWEYWRTRLEA